jgi:hypothetical protein
VAAVVSASVAVGGVTLATWPGDGLLVASVVGLGAALVVAGSRPVLPAVLHPGPAIGAGLVAGGVGAAVCTAGLIAAMRTLQHVSPLWTTELAVTGPHPPLLTWQLPAAIVAVTAAFTVVVPKALKVATTAGGLALALLAVPSSFALVWWAPAALSLAAAAAASAVMLAGRTRTTTVPTGVVALVLVLNAIGTSLVRPGLSAAVLGGTAVIGLAVAVIGTAGGERPGRATMTRLASRSVSGCCRPRSAARSSRRR